LQFLADTNKSAELAPPSGTLERERLRNGLNFTSSELHKAFSPYFSGRKLEGAEKERVDATLTRRVGDVERGLADGRSYILGPTSRSPTFICSSCSVGRASSVTTLHASRM
jgi:glutathione S-transferase